MIITDIWSRESLPRTVQILARKRGGVVLFGSARTFKKLDQEDDKEEREDLMRKEVIVVIYIKPIAM